MKYLTIDKSIKILYRYAIVLCIIFASRDTLLSWNNSWFMFAGIAMTIILLIPIAFWKRYINLQQIRKVSILAVIVCLSMVANLDFRGYSMFIVLFIALGITEAMEFEQFYAILENIILVISLLSLAAVICKISGHTIFLSDIMYIADNEALPWGFRLYGIFREPAMYCIYLGIALGRQLFFLETPAFLRILVYLSALLLTGSTTGYIAILFAAACYIVINRNEKRYYPIYIIGIIGAIIIGLRYGVLDYFLKRLSVHGASGYSSSSRYYSIIGGAFVGITHPFLGAGAVKSGIEFEKFMCYLGKGAAWANMVTYLWASFGIIFVYIFLRGIYNTALMKKESIAISFLIFIMLLLCGETMTYSSIMYIFMLYGYSNKRQCGYILKTKVKRRNQYAI